jgi:hypothetical protein
MGRGRRAEGRVKGWVGVRWGVLVVVVTAGMGRDEGFGIGAAFNDAVPERVSELREDEGADADEGMGFGGGGGRDGYDIERTFKEIRKEESLLIQERKRIVHSEGEFGGLYS